MTNLHEPDLPSGIKILDNETSARLKQRYPNLPASPERGCVTCGGKKTYRWYAPNSRSEVVTYDCNCVDQWVLHRYLLASGVGVNYGRLGWLDLHDPDQAALRFVSDYVSNAQAYFAAGVGVILSGTYGTGKTLISTLLLRALLAQGHDGYFTTFSEMIDTYTGGWNDREEKVWFHKRVKNAGVLVLDDVGREWQGRKSSGLPEATFDEVLRHRVAASTPTIITTNLDEEGMTLGYGKAVKSLLGERSRTLRIEGEDFRPQSRLRLDQEISQGLTRPLVLA